MINYSVLDLARLKEIRDAKLRLHERMINPDMFPNYVDSHLKDLDLIEGLIALKEKRS